MTEWHVYIDGACSGNPGESGAGIVVLDGEGDKIHSESIYLGCGNLPPDRIAETDCRNQRSRDNKV